MITLDKNVCHKNNHNSFFYFYADVFTMKCVWTPKLYSSVIFTRQVINVCFNFKLLENRMYPLKPHTHTHAYTLRRNSLDECVLWITKFHGNTGAMPRLWEALRGDVKGYFHKVRIPPLHHILGLELYTNTHTHVLSVWPYLCVELFFFFFINTHFSLLSII